MRPAECACASQSVEMNARSKAPSARPRRVNRASCNGLRSSASISRRASRPLVWLKSANCLAMAFSNGSNFRTAMRILALMRPLPIAFQPRLQSDGLGTVLQCRQHAFDARAALFFQHGDGERRLHGRLRRSHRHADVQSAHEALTVGTLVTSGADCGKTLQEGCTPGRLFALPIFFAPEDLVANIVFH